LCHFETVSKGKSYVMPLSFKKGPYFLSSVKM
jgi:hypothetical protein